MKLSNHAEEQLYARYEKWGLDIVEALYIIRNLKFESDDTYRMVIIDDIPLVLICDGNEIITVYPHPVDAAEEWRDLHNDIKLLKHSNAGLRNAVNTCNGRIQKQEKYIDKLEKKLKKREKQVKEMWK